VNRREFFDRHAAGWDRDRPPDLEARLARVVEVAGIAPGWRVLDVGAGTGPLIPHLAEAVGEAGLVVAVDFAMKMLAQAKAKGLGARARLAQASVAVLPFAAGRFDAVTCNAAFPHFPDHRRALSEMARVLRPGGRLVISLPVGRAAVEAIHHQAGGPIEHDSAPDAEAMRSMLEAAGLRVVSVIDEPEFFVVVGERRI